MDKISVVVPAYNCQDTIERCIKSIQNQTYKNLEIIVVNDGSTDNTEQVLNDIQRADNRIKVFNIDNGGVSHARNTGIDNATGNYITFVDADDYIDEEMYECLYNQIKEYNVKIAHCSYKAVDGDIIKSIGDTGKVVLQDHDEAMKCLLSGRLFIGGLCNKLYDKSLFDSIRLEESIKFNEDVLANYYLFDNVKESVYMDRAFYSYVQNTSSSTHSVNSNIGVEHVVRVADIMSKKSKGKAYQTEADDRYAYLSLTLYRAYLFSNFISIDERNKKKDLKERIKTMKGIYTGKNRINYVLLMYFPIIYKFSYKVYSLLRTKNLDPSQ